ncbi:uncharacterized protein LOC132271715 isoform X4 [Cornus florida]|uniref:uncharacterized protein LOC132271715 isoform X4 n=1 Tax=Cornus florida TaxID=4283 RepID=UPI00289B3F9A|nr:uncharacterized protein LOC132271715 isoform X4 [Cornus florida]
MVADVPNLGIPSIRFSRQIFELIESALRERKVTTKKLKKASSTQEDYLNSGSPASTSAGKNQQNAADVQHFMQKFDLTTAEVNNISRGKQISPVVFYGSPHGVPPKRPSRLLRLLHEIHIDFTEQNKLRKEVWATFPRQDEAMKFVKEHTHARLFSYQDHMNGQRRFLASTYKEFWRRYKNMNSKFRRHYEVIQEAMTRHTSLMESNIFGQWYYCWTLYLFDQGLPCHLYFDLEFSKKDNAEKNGDEMVDLLISVIFEALLEKYSVEGNQEWIVELDSSTKEKFSRHLVIHIPKSAFKDNSHAGAFVAEICSRIISARERDGKYEELFISKDSCSGKNSFLVPTERFKCKGMSEEGVFMESLICNMDVDCEKLLICKMDIDCVKALHFDTEINSNFHVQSAASQEFALNTCINDVSRTYLMGKSPFPALDMFIESVASIGNVSGKIRSWYWFSEYALMVYSMSRNRYCERIGRQHKSNHVMYVVDLQRAVYYQKCYDPDCRGYRSPLRPIPVDAVPDSRIFFKSVGHNEGSMDNTLQFQSVEKGQEHIPPYSNESIIDSCKKDGWWLEAISYADKIENMQKTLDLSGMDEIHDYDEEDWWLAVERTTSQAELAYQGDA